MSMTADERLTNRGREESLAATITIGVDGRLYFHDVTPDILSVAAAICPQAPAVRCRRAAWNATGRENDDCYRDTNQEA